MNNDNQTKRKSPKGQRIMKKRTPSLEEFIDGAKDNKARRAKRKHRVNEILLVVSGRKSDRSEYAKNLNVWLNPDVLADMEKHCVGNRQGVINYLLRRGLDQLIEANERIIEEMD